MSKQCLTTCSSYYSAYSCSWSRPSRSTVFLTRICPRSRWITRCTLTPAKRIASLNMWTRVRLSTSVSRYILTDQIDIHYRKLSDWKNKIESNSVIYLIDHMVALWVTRYFTSRESAMWTWHSGDTFPALTVCTRLANFYLAICLWKRWPSGLISVRLFSRYISFIIMSGNW